MGLIGRILGAEATARQVGGAIGGVAEVFVGNRAEREAAAAELVQTAMQQHGAEFAGPGAGRFDRFVNALNRVPRPLLVLGTLALFGYAMIAPAGFSVRMEGLALVPEPLWWLLGAIVSFYFGARELHHQRKSGLLPKAVAASVAAVTRPAEIIVRPDPTAAPEPASPYGAEAAAAPEAAPTAVGIVPAGAMDTDRNAALEEWRSLRA